jgi:hypothetical protein
VADAGVTRADAMVEGSMVRLVDWRRPWQARSELLALVGSWNIWVRDFGLTGTNTTMQWVEN